MSRFVIAALGGLLVAVGLVWVMYAGGEPPPVDEPVAQPAAGSESSGIPDAPASEDSAVSSLPGSASEAPAVPPRPGSSEGSWRSQPHALTPGPTEQLISELQDWLADEGLDERGLSLGQPDCSEVPCITPFRVDLHVETKMADRRRFLAEARSRAGQPDVRLFVTGRSGGQEHAVLYWNPSVLGPDERRAIDASVERRSGGGIEEEESEDVPVPTSL